MSTTTRLLVLGAVRIFQPVHGYDLRRELLSWHVQDWASVAPGSIYNALKSLTKDGLIEVVGTKQVGGRPERTTYRLTPRGDEEFTEMLRDTWWTVRPPVDPLAAAVSLISFMPRAEVILALEARIAQVEGQLKHGEHAVAAITDTADKPAHVREVIRLVHARVASEIDWARALIVRLQDGEYTLGDDPPWIPPSATKSVSPTKTASTRAAAAKLAAAPKRAAAAKLAAAPERAADAKLAAAPKRAAAPKLKPAAAPKQAATPKPAAASTTRPPKPTSLTKPLKPPGPRPANR